MLMEDDTTLDAIRDLILPRYRLADYDNPKVEHAAADTKNLDDIRSGRGNVSGFVRIGLFKRLSSSGHSFILSLQRQRARNELFIHAIDNRLSIPLGAFSDKQIAITDEDIEERRGAARQHRHPLPIPRRLLARQDQVGQQHRLQDLAAQGPGPGQRHHHDAARPVRQLGLDPRLQDQRPGRPAA